MTDDINAITGDGSTTLSRSVGRLIEGYDPMYSIDWDYAIYDEMVFDGTNSIDTGLQLGLEDKDRSYFVEYQADEDCTANSGVVFCQDIKSPYQGTAVYWKDADSVRIRMNASSGDIDGRDGMAKIRIVYIRDKEAGTMCYVLPST